jgi:hypothetical protein
MCGRLACNPDINNLCTHTHTNTSCQLYIHSLPTYASPPGQSVLRMAGKYNTPH